MHEKQPPRKCSDQCFKAHSDGNSPKKITFLQIKSIGRSFLAWAGQISVQGMLYLHCGNPINISGQLPDTKQGLGIILVWAFLFIFVVIVSNKIKV